MKRTIVILWAMVMAAKAWAASEVVDGVTWYYSTSAGKATIASGVAKYAGDLTVPSVLGDCLVTRVGESAFYECSRLTSVRIPKGVTGIGPYAFSGCGGLKSVMIPATVTDIEIGAFSDCGELKTIIVDVDNPKYKSIDNSLLSKDGETLIRGPNSISVMIPNGVTHIGLSAFSGCGELTSVTIPMGVANIGSYAFSGCSGLTSVTIPASVTSIGYSAFSDCSGLTRVDIADLEKWCGISFGSGANPLYYAHRLYLRGEEVKNLVIPAGVTGIGSYAFHGCSGLTSATIPEGVTSIGYSAFHGCSGLTSVMFPTSVTSIESYAFYGCSGLMRVDISDLEKWCGISFGSSSSLPPLSLVQHLYLNGEEVRDLVIPDGVTSVAPRAFYGCCGLTSVTIPSGVTSIGYSAFDNCTGLKSVEFLGAPPSDLSSRASLLSYGIVRFPREYGAEWQKIIGLNSFRGYLQDRQPVVEIVSAAIRENDSTVMDVVYRVKSAKPTVKVRALAFQAGVRSFANVVKVTDLIEGTAAHVGDAIAANEEHKLSWRIASDWAIDLAKVKFEVLAREGDLLQLELTTIPKTANHAAMEISWNAITSQQVLDAMLWMYADGEDRLTVAEGKAFWDGNLAVNGTTLQSNSSSYYSRTKNPETGKYDYVYCTNATECVYSRMGFGTLSGDELKYANEMTRLGLSPSGVRQYAWREVEE